MKSLFCFFLLLVGTASSRASDGPWMPVGPYGGDARRIAADPGDAKHLYLGTTSSWLYQSTDGGGSWKRVSKLSKEENLVLDSIIVDASDHKTILVGAWVFDRPGGALFISHDAGATWKRAEGMDGQSVRALAEARSDAKVYVAGTLTGVYRSEDHGEHWALISPEGSQELHEVESIAIDPADPTAIFAGTWHLPWKTTDGGKSWHTIKQGVIDDSDVFSIIIDPKQPATVYASACSGIYKSLDAGELFHKVQGIPATARRTRVLMQDPANLNVVYAGTTEGLYQTTNGGDQWARLTGPDVVVNDVYVDSSDSKHVLMATDRSGVLMSDDSGVTFHDANGGFSQRQVAALLTDAQNPHMIYAGVLNDKSYGGVFVSEDDGSHWKQQSDGLGGLDVFSLGEGPDGTLFAGTNHGLYRWNGKTWEQNGVVVPADEEKAAPAARVTRRKGAKRVSASGARKSGPVGRAQSKRAVKAIPRVLIDVRVNALDLRGGVWFAATSSGVYRSSNEGVSWQAAESPKLETSSPAAGGADASATEAAAAQAPRVDYRLADYRMIDASGPVAFAAARKTVARSEDGGKTWQNFDPGGLSSVEALAATPEGEVWIGGREGTYYSDDKGETWQQLKGIPMVGISGLTYDPDQKRILVTSWQSSLIFGINPADKTWKWWDSGWTIHAVRWADGRMVGVSRYDGVVVQPGEPGGATVPGGR